MYETDFDGRCLRTQGPRVVVHGMINGIYSGLTSSKCNCLGGLTIGGNKLSNLELSVPGSSNSCTFYANQIRYGTYTTLYGTGSVFSLDLCNRWKENLRSHFGHDVGSCVSAETTEFFEPSSRIRRNRRTHRGGGDRIFRRIRKFSVARCLNLSSKQPVLRSTWIWGGIASGGPFRPCIR